MFFSIRLIALFWLAALWLPAQADSASILAKAQAANPTRYAFAVAKNAEIRNTSDNKAFTIWWQPSATTAPSGVIVSLHGHASYATDEFYLWQSYAEKKGYAILALQWWFGGGETTSDYYQPAEMYPLISSLLAEKGVKHGSVLLHGYSRGSANSYAVTAIDAASGNHFIGMTLSNSGGAIAGFPPNQQIVAGAYGAQPFAGVQWMLYCGELDPDPTLSGCPAMKQAKDWVVKYGAAIALFIDDSTGGHGGFMLNSVNVDAAMTTFAGYLATRPPTIDVCQVFPSNHIFNTRIDTFPVHPDSAAYLQTINSGTRNLHLDLGQSENPQSAEYYGIPYNLVTGATLAWSPVYYDNGWPDESDCAAGEHSVVRPCVNTGSQPVMPIPPSPLVEGGIESNPANDGDHHILVVDRSQCVLWESYHSYPHSGGGWDILSSAAFDLNSNNLRPAGWTSSDAAGFPILPLLLRADEASSGEIRHALRFTIQSSKIRNTYVWPARHLTSNGGSSSAKPAMGQLFRLKSDYPISASFTAQARAILVAMQRYGMYVADGGSDMYIQGEPSAGWSSDTISQVQTVPHTAFEAVDLSPVKSRTGFNPDSAAVPVAEAPGACPQASLCVDLAVEQAMTPALASTGRDLLVWITTKNSGPASASSVTLTDTLPAGAQFIWASPACAHASGTVTCNLGTLASGAGALTAIVLRPAAAGTILNTASISATQTDSNPANNASTATTPVSSTTPGVAVARYRLYSPVTLEHHFTTDLNEYTVLGANSAWRQEGEVGKMLNNPGTFNGVTAVPYYRLFNPASRWHHWTTDANEYYTLSLLAGWSGEGLDGYILPSATTGATRLYRLVSRTVAGLHHWTIDANEFRVLTGSGGWSDEGGSGFVIQ